MTTAPPTPPTPASPPPPTTWETTTWETTWETPTSSATTWASDQENFMHACGQTTATRNLIQAELYDRLIEEEAHEFLRAESIVTKIDGAVDLIVVAIGFLHSLGIDPNEAWSIVHQANMAKLGGPKRSDGKQLKPEGWVGPEAELQKLYDGVPQC